MALNGLQLELELDGQAFTDVLFTYEYRACTIKHLGKEYKFQLLTRDEIDSLTPKDSAINRYRYRPTGLNEQHILIGRHNRSVVVLRPTLRNQET